VLTSPGFVDREVGSADLYNVVIRESGALS
jgi:hypothetical protein